ncbi:MAG: ferrous iron transport protein A [Acidobacteriota bacterium]|jgi:hypothetical protein
MFRTRKSETEPLVGAPQRCLECPMCRAPLSAETIAGVCSSCPLYHMRSGCGIDLIACPQCGYHSLPGEHDGALQPATGSSPPAAPAGQPARIAPEVAACAGATRLSEVRPGTRARLLGFNGIDDNHLGRLTAYGLLPGVAVEVLQRFPAIILGVYQAELALETELAGSIWVLPET